jgi:hypothetical protein
MVRLQDRWPHPFLIAVPKYDVQKGSVADDQLPPTRRDSATAPGVRPPEGPTAKILPIRADDYTADVSSRYPDRDDLQRLLEDVCTNTNPLTGVAERYRRLEDGQPIVEHASKMIW